MHNPVPRLLCPFCSREYKSDVALLAHAESNKSRCGIKSHPGWRHFVDQITGGLIDVAGRDSAGNYNYVVSPEAMALYGPAQTKVGALDKGVPENGYVVDEW